MRDVWAVRRNADLPERSWIRGSGHCTGARRRHHGVGVQTDIKRSNSFYELASQHAQVDQVDSAASAFVVYMDGCNRGDTLGCFNAASMLAEGIEVDRNVATARDLYGQACDDGCPLACERQKKIRIRNSGKDGL